ncbi:hypothetical protein FWF74_00675 [Candidatus Saccharibacteria bacterium]|nr:hypothetical protein [Candidatus Saccharibacteria bacterium]MCL1963308.1 hypothetical protein [Candidatus Saccharibacteria bacterium]
MAKIKIGKILALVMLIGTLIFAGLIDAAPSARAASASYELVWNRAFDGGGDHFNAVISSSDGGTIVAGSSFLYRPSVIALQKGDEDAIIVKYDSDGELKWVKSFGGSDADRFNSAAPTSDGGFIAAGISCSTDGDFAAHNNGSCDAIIAKFNVNATLQWYKNFGGSDYDEFESIALAPGGGYIAVGYSSSNDGDLLGMNNGGGDAVIAKFSSNGTLEWRKTFGGSDFDEFTSVAASPSGGYAAVGYSQSNNGDLAGLNQGDDDAIVVKFSANGTLEWNKNFGGSSYERFESVAPAPDGGFVAVGNHLYSNYHSAVIKLDSSGDTEWYENFDASDGSDFYSVIPTTDGYVIAGGLATTSPFGEYFTDPVVVKYNFDGTLEWYKNFSNSDYNGAYGTFYYGRFYSVTVSADGGYAAVGSLNRGKGGDTDVVIAKYHDATPPTPTIPPLYEPTDPNGSIDNVGCNPVKVTLTTNIPIVIPSGWTQTGNNTYTKIYARNTTETIVLVGLNGVTGASVPIVVDMITCKPGVTPPNAGIGDAARITELSITGFIILAVVGMLMRRACRSRK